MHIRSEVLSGMDEVKPFPCYSFSFSSRHDSIANILNFVTGLQYPFVAII